MAEYTNRHIEEITADTVTYREDGWVEVTADSTAFQFRPTRTDIKLEPGPFHLETTRGSFVTGVGAWGTWIMHKSDEDLEREHEEFKEKRQADLRDRWSRHHAAWLVREEALPDWIKPRLATFHERGGKAFEIDGWEYELTIAELAAMYRESGGEDSPDIREYAKLHGTSGNQHGFAKALAAAPPEVTIGETIGALTPLGAHPFYAEETPDGKHQD